MAVVGRSLPFNYNIVTGPFMRTARDALRSLHKYVASILPDGSGGNGEPWEVRLWDEEGTFRRPFARVALVGAPVYSVRATWSDVTQPMAVHLYPQEQDTVEAGILLASEVDELLFQGFGVGIGLGRPMRVPFYNFANVPLDGPFADSLARHEHDFLRVVPESLNINRLHDPVDDRLITVICDLRLTWRRRGRSIVGKPVQSVKPMKFDPVS